MERRAQAALAPVSVLRRSHDHHRDIPARLLAALPSRDFHRRHQDRHIMIKPVHDDIPVLQFYFAGSRPATPMLAAAPLWTHRLVDQSPLRDAHSAYRDRSTEFATPA